MAARKFGVFILTHGRPANVITVRSLERCGYTGPVWLLCDDEDERLSEYHERWGEKVIVFDKKKQAASDDAFDMSGNRRTILHARNYCWTAAKSLGLTHFIQLDDDYSSFGWVTTNSGRYLPNGQDGVLFTKRLDAIFSALCDFLDRTTVLTVAMAQGGDLIGGENGGMVEMARRWLFKRKAMNSFVCRTDRPIKFRGRLNEDVNTYVGGGLRGGLFVTVPRLRLWQPMTQSQAGGITETYLEDGTYRKAFSTVMEAPGCVEVRVMGSKNKRLHHHVLWGNTCPKIIPDLPPAPMLGATAGPADGLDKDPGRCGDPRISGTGGGGADGPEGDRGPLPEDRGASQGEGQQLEETVTGEPEGLAGEGANGEGCGLAVFRDLARRKRNRSEWARLLGSVLPWEEAAHLARVADAGASALAKSNPELEPAELVGLRSRWYESLRIRGVPDFSIYEDPLYLAEALLCWDGYSRKYINEIQKPVSMAEGSVVDRLGDVRSVADLGNGVGLSTAALAQVFSRAMVFGTNVEGSPQWDLSKLLGSSYGFSTVGSIESVPSPVDIVFASEYFEHFPEPIAHLREVVAALAPTFMLVANAFSADSSGHFDCYTCDGVSVNGKKVGRLFGVAMRELGYEKIKTKMWNQRPSFWWRVAP